MLVHGVGFPIIKVLGHPETTREEMKGLRSPTLASPLRHSAKGSSNAHYKFMHKQ